MIRIIIKTERRIIPGAPIIVSHEVIEIDAPTVANRINSGGYNEDGTFEVSQVISVEVPVSSPIRRTCTDCGKIEPCDDECPNASTEGSK
jgi:hypothetical protein